MENPQSFTARRPAATGLPNFQLPPPDLSGMHKFPAFPPTNTSQPTVSSVLTPPSGVSNDGLSPLSSSVNSGSSQSSTNGVPPYNPMGFWPGPQSGYSFSSAPQMPAPFAQNPVYMSRPIYSPGMNYSSASRNGNSPSGSESLPPPPYELSLPPFPTSSSMSGPTGGSSNNLPTLAPQQHPQQHQQPHQQQQQQQQQQMANLMSSQPPPSQTPQQQSAPHAPENYGGRPPPTPTYNYAPTSTPQQSSFPAYTHPSPTQQSPVTSGPNQSRISPAAATNGPPSMQPPPGHYSHSRPYGAYALPAMSGPIMSNVHSPGTQMQMVGGMNIPGYPPPHMGQHMYLGHGGQSTPQNDRPFKCDQCPQSFNRNHDLKRHKRIHLAVKPFPCGHCEKSFSRKDALKRHILVKGCGKTGQTNGTAPNAGSQSPHAKPEGMDNSSDASPEAKKRES